MEKNAKINCMNKLLNFYNNVFTFMNCIILLGGQDHVFFNLVKPI